MRILASVLLLILIGSPSLRAGDYDALLKQANGYANFTRGMRAFAGEEMKQAFDFFVQADEGDPKLGRAHFHRADILFIEGKYADAVAGYQSAIALEPDYVFAYYNLACAYARTGDSEKALAAIEETLRRGYNRYEKIKDDPDFESLKNLPKFEQLIQVARLRKVEPAIPVKFLLCTPEEKSKMILEILQTSSSDWQSVADKALLDSSHDARIGGATLYSMLGSKTQALPILVRGIYDANDSVSGTVSKLMAILGSESLPYTNAILASQDEDAKVRAREVQKLIQEMTAGQK